MKARDVLLVLAVLAVGGFAMADAVRDDDEGARPAAQKAASTEAEPALDSGPLAPERTPPVPAAGSLVFTDAGDCRLREVTIAGGRERTLPAISTSCHVWAAPVGRRLAFGSEGSTETLAALRFLDLARPEDVTEPAGFVGPVVWTSDGRRAAWCDSASSGYERVFPGARTEELAFCPRGYVRGRLARVRDRELVVGGKVVGAARHIEQVATGVNGEVAVVLEGGAIERIAADGTATGLRLPGLAVASALVFSPDLCAAAAVGPQAVAIVDLGCFRGRGQVVTVSTDNCINRRQGPNAKCARYLAPRTFTGAAAAWSPDGRWLAVAEPQAIAFHRVVGGYRVIRWPARAADLAWIG